MHEPKRTRIQIRNEALILDSAQSVFADLRTKGETVGLSTVYRHLQALTDSGEVDTVQTSEGELLYRLCGQTDRHHHHLVCRICGRSEEIEGPAVEEWAHSVAAQHGFTDVEHTVEVFGTCGDCATSA